MRGLVLEGGGARGAYEIGACKALRESGVEFQGISGTSVGALNGAMLAQGSLQQAVDMWYDIRPSKIFKVNEKRLEEFKNLHINTQNIPYYVKYLHQLVRNGGLDVSPLRRLLMEQINEERIRTSGVDFGVVTVSLSDRRALEIFLEDIPAGQLVSYLMASASFPAFKSKRMEGKLFIDGGFHDNLPFKMLYLRGYKDLVAVRTYAPGRVRPHNQDQIKLLEIGPNEDLGRIMDFDHKLIRKNIQLGYYDAMRVLRKLNGRRYYIEPCQFPNYILEKWINLDEININKLADILGIQNISPRRMLFERIIPHLSNMLHAGKNSSYEEIAVLLLEELAEEFKVERFKIYSFNEFKKQVIGYIPASEEIAAQGSRRASIDFKEIASLLLF